MDLFIKFVVYGLIIFFVLGVFYKTYYDNGIKGLLMVVVVIIVYTAQIFYIASTEKNDKPKIEATTCIEQQQNSPTKIKSEKGFGQEVHSE